MYVTLFLNAFLLHCVALYCVAYSCSASVANKRHHKVWSNFTLVKILHQSTITARRFLILCIKMLARRLTGANLFCYICTLVNLYITRYQYQHHKDIFGPIANLKGPYFQPSLSVCLSVCLLAQLQTWSAIIFSRVCLSVSDRHFYPSTLTNFDEIWSQGPTLI